MWGARILILDAALRRVASLAGISSNPRLSKMFATPISSSTFSSLDFNYLFVCLFVCLIGALTKCQSGKALKSHMNQVPLDVDKMLDCSTHHKLKIGHFKNILTT